MIYHGKIQDAVLVTGAAAGMDDRVRCAHDIPMLALKLQGATGKGRQEIDLLLPTCEAPAMFGYALAIVSKFLGADAATEFLDNLQSARDHALAGLADAVMCCEAGFRSGGREHTCDQTAQGAGGERTS